MLPPAAVAAIRNCLRAWKIMSGNQDKLFSVVAAAHGGESGRELSRTFNARK
jgi:hypothetical protein